MDTLCTQQYNFIFFTALTHIRLTTSLSTWCMRWQRCLHCLWSERRGTLLWLRYSSWSSLAFMQSWKHISKMTRGARIAQPDRSNAGLWKMYSPIAALLIFTLRMFPDQPTPMQKKKKKKTLLGYLHIECSWHVRNKLSIQWCPEKKSSWDRMRKTYEKARLPRLKKMFSDPGDWASFICKHCLQTTASASLEDTNLRHIAIGHKQPSGW